MEFKKPVRQWVRFSFGYREANDAIRAAFRKWELLKLERLVTHYDYQRLAYELCDCWDLCYCTHPRQWFDIETACGRHSWREICEALIKRMEA